MTTTTMMMMLMRPGSPDALRSNLAQDSPGARCLWRVITRCFATGAGYGDPESVGHVHSGRHAVRPVGPMWGARNATTPGRRSSWSTSFATRSSCARGTSKISAGARLRSSRSSVKGTPSTSSGSVTAGLYQQCTSSIRSIGKILGLVVGISTPRIQCTWRL